MLEKFALRSFKKFFQLSSLYLHCTISIVHIHPFLDNNGRTAQLLSTLCLYKFGYDFKKNFTKSEYYDRNQVNYCKASQSVRDKNMDMTVWLEYFSKSLETQMHEIQFKGTYANEVGYFASSKKS